MSSWCSIEGPAGEINLLSWPYYVATMTSNSPEVRTSKDQFSFAQGEEVLYARYNNVTEEYTIFVCGDTQADVDTNREKLEILIQDLMVGVNDTNATCYVELRPDGSTYTYRSPIFYASIVGKAENRLIEGDSVLLASGHAGAKYIQVALIFERAYYWESLTEESLPMTNGNYTDETEDLAIYNHDDSGTGHDNWVEVYAHDIKGTIPSPLRIILLNTFATSSFTNVHISRNGRNVDTFAHWYETENMSLYTGTTVINGANYSGGSAVRIQHADSTVYQNFRKSVSSLFSQSAASRWFRVLLMCTSTSNDTYFRVRLSIGSSETPDLVYVTLPYVLAKKGVMDMGVLKIPNVPFFKDGTEPAVLNIDVLSYNLVGATDTYLDAMAIVPSGEDDTYCKLTNFLSVPYNQRLMMSPESELIYDFEVESVTGHIINTKATHTITGSWPTIRPGYDNLFYFIFEYPTDGYVANATASVTMKYRPRRLKI